MKEEKDNGISGWIFFWYFLGILTDVIIDKIKGV